MYIDWVYLASNGALEGMMMWDRIVVEKLEVFIVEFIVACSLRSLEDNFYGLLLEFMGLILTVT